MEQTTLQYWLGIAKDSIPTASFLTATILGWTGLSTWRRQLKTNTNHDLAKRTLKAVFVVRNELRYVRNPFRTGGEIAAALLEFGEPVLSESDPDFRKKSTIAVYERRWRRLADALTGLYTLAVEVEALWGQALSTRILALDQQAVILNINIQQYIQRMYSSRPISDVDFEHYKAANKVVYSTSNIEKCELDEFDAAIKSVIDKIEADMRPYLKL